MEGLGFDTNAVHGGESPDAATGAINTPVYLSSTFQQDAVGQDRGFDYARSGNPSRASLERHLALLEGADFGFAFASGLAAEDAVLRLLSPGDHLVMQTDSYGGTFRLATEIHGPAGLVINAIDLSHMDELWQPATRMVWL